MSHAVDERARRLAAACDELGVDALLLACHDNVVYATGCAGTAELGPSPHAGGPNLALITRAGQVGHVVADLEGDDARAARGDVVGTYETFAPRPHAAPMHELLSDAAAALVDDLGLRGARVACDAGLPAVVRAGLDGALGAWVDAHPAVLRARATKTVEEIAQLRRCAELARVGQEAVLAGARPGITELALFAQARSAIEHAAGETFALGVDLLSGVERTASVMGGPGLRVLAPGDPILCDLGPRVGGYWGDSCSAFALAPEPPAAYVRLHDAVREGLEQAAALIAPGLAVDALDAAVRGPIVAAGFAAPLHTGHGIGTANFEFPRIVPGETARLHEGMVLMLEPGGYDPEVGGVRLEWTFLVTAGGNEPLSPHVVALTSS